MPSPTTLPITDGHRALWFAQAATPGSTDYQCAELITFDGEVDVDVLAETIADCLGRCDDLNVRFEPASDGSVRRIAQARDHSVTRVDLPSEVEDVVEWASAKIAVPAMTTQGVIAGDELSGNYIIKRADGGFAWLSRFHHILGDGMSFQTLINWISRCYTARVKDMAEPDFPFQSAADQLAASEQSESAEQSSSEPETTSDTTTETTTAATDEDYWRTADLPDEPGLIRHAIGIDSGDELVHATATLSSDDRAALRAVAKRTKTSELEALLAAIGHYAASVCGHQQVCVGLPVMGRTMGAPLALTPMVNILPIAITAGATSEGENPVDELLTAVSETLTAARQHASIRTEVIRRLRGHTMTPLTGADVNFRPFSPKLKFGDATSTFTTISIGPITDIEFMAESADDGGLALTLLARGSDRERDTRLLQRTAGHIVTLLKALADDETPAATEYLTEDENTELAQFNQTGRPLSVGSDLTLSRLIARQRENDLSARPDAPALWWDGQDLTWRETWEMVDRIAAWLYEQGTGPGDIVSLELDRSVALSVALAAVARVGAAWVPISPTLPQARREYMREVSQPVTTIAATDSADAISGATSDAAAATDTAAPTGSDTESGPILYLNPHSLHPTDGLVQDTDETTSALSAESVSSIVTKLDRRAQDSATDDLAYILFTSGSTGRPKAVAIEQLGIVNRLDWMATDYSIDQQATIMQKTPSSFDVSMWEFLLPFTFGARQAIASPDAHRDPMQLASDLHNSGATICHFVPSALKALLATAKHLPELPDLVQVFTSGEALELSVARQCVETLKVKLHNLYGPTEAAIDVTAHTLSSDDTEMPIGGAVANTRLFILDDWGHRVPLGVEGTLYLSGCQLARGYLKQPEKTAEVFVANPFVTTSNDDANAGAGDGTIPGAETYARMYNTGDRVSVRADGAIRYHGRRDFQLKLRGQRIELGEIEAVVSAAPHVGQCAVVVKTMANEPTIVAYIVYDDDADKETTHAADAESPLDKIASYAEKYLASYMIPAHWVQLDALPTTSNGKLDSGALPTPTSNSAQVEPSTATEQQIHQCFCDVLGTGKVSTVANFFTLGGHSLSAVQLISAVNDALGTELSIADVFAHPTIAELAECADATLSASRSGQQRVDSQGFKRLLPLRPHHKGSPVFCFYPAGGLGWSYSGLVSMLDADRGIYAVQSPGLLDKSQRVESITQAAQVATDDILAECRQMGVSQVALVGWSVGGVVAQAVAAQLGSDSAAGAVADSSADRVAIDSLILLDAYPAELWRTMDDPGPQDLLRGVLNMAGIVAGDNDYTNEEVCELLQHSKSAFASLTMKEIDGIMTMIDHNARMMREHTTQAWAGPMVHFKALRNPEHMDEQSWAPFVDSLDVIEVDTTHPGLVAAENLRKVAQALETR